MFLKFQTLLEFFIAGYESERLWCQGTPPEIIPQLFRLFLQMQNVEALKNLQLRQLRGVETTGADMGAPLTGGFMESVWHQTTEAPGAERKRRWRNRLIWARPERILQKKIWDFWKRVFFQDFLIGWIPFMTELNLRSTIISWICGCLSWNEGGIPSRIGNCKNSTWALFMMSATGRWSREWESSKGMYSVRVWGTKLANKRL